eukprot:m.1338544 g.1338544  ORF g.1338544 m.1338544 type:complete len:364 (-) comp24884_c0_seq29:2204-3295(-)
MLNGTCRPCVNFSRRTYMSYARVSSLGGGRVHVYRSAQYLQMKPLVDECLAYFRDNFNAIVKAHDDFSWITEEVLSEFVPMFSLTDLEAIEDEHDKLSSRMFWRRLAALCKPGQPGSDLFRCTLCHRVLYAACADATPCTQLARIGFHGEFTYTHIRDPAWNINEYVAQMQVDGQTARGIFWRMWGHVHYFRCTTCMARFPFYELRRCWKHAQLPTFSDDGSIAHYKCCGLRTPRFAATPPAVHGRAGGGCMATEHTIDDAAADANTVANMQYLRRHHDDICFGVPTTHGTTPAGRIGCSDGGDARHQHCRVSVFWEEECAVGVSANAAMVKLSARYPGILEIADTLELFFHIADTLNIFMIC